MNLPDPDAPLCSSGKRPFRTRELADKALSGARHLRANMGPGRVPGSVEADVFECPVCRWWHLSSATGSRRRGVLSNRGRRQPKRR